MMYVDTSMMFGTHWGLFMQKKWTLDIYWE